MPEIHRRIRRVTLMRCFAWALACAGGIALAYFLGARLALQLIARPEGITAIWPPSGLWLAAEVWRVWWVADGVGILLVTLVILTWTTGDSRVCRPLTLPQGVEALCPEHWGGGQRSSSPYQAGDKS